MTERLRAVLHDRITDPVAWFAIGMMGIWAAAAVWGVSPLPLLSGVAIAGSLSEWITLARWHHQRRRAPSGASLPLKQATDRWKVLVVILVSLLTLGLELWIDSTQGGGFWNVGLTFFGVSTLLFLWYAWSRPVEVDAHGLMLGANRVAWSDVTDLVVTPGERSHLEFELSRAHYLFGTRLSVWLTDSQLEELSRLLPAGRLSVGHPAQTA